MKINLKEALEILKKGGTPIAIPTETVYGLAVRADDPKGLENLYKLKRRDKNKPLTLQIFDRKLVKAYASISPSALDSLMEAFWPGPLTLVLPANPASTSSLLRGGKETLGIRIPCHPLTLQLLFEAGPLAVPSANFSGETPCVSREQVESMFSSAFPVLDGGLCPFGIASTVLEFSASGWKILREGAISEEKILKILK